MMTGILSITTGIERGWPSYFVVVSVLLLIGTLVFFAERGLPYKPTWLESKGDLSLDTVYYVVNYGIKIVAQLLFAFAVGQVEFLKVFPGRWALVWQALLALAVIDFFLFLAHWLSHQWVWLWRLHAVHHSSERLYFLNGEKRHALHQIIEGLPGITVCLVLGASPQAVAAALGILGVNMLLQHCNVDYRTGWLKQVFSVAELHRWHHRTDYQDAQCNYGAWLVVWDRLFGTYYAAERVYTQVGRVGIGEEPDFPRTYWQQFLYPFRRSRR